MSDKNEGLIYKYNVERVDGKPVGDGIFLQFDDPLAKAAILTWAITMRSRGYEVLYEDIKRKLGN